MKTSKELRTFQAKLNKTVEWFRKELTRIPTGRISPSILDGILVKINYGKKEEKKK